MVWNIILVAPPSCAEAVPADCLRCSRLRVVRAFDRPEAALRFLQSGYAADAVIVRGIPIPPDFPAQLALCSPNTLLICVTRPGAQLPAMPRLYLRIFGSFDVFCGKEALHFPNSKSKELLALCVHRRGGYVSMDEACNLLWPDKPYDQRVKRLYRKAVSSLHHVLQDSSDTVIFENLRGKCRVLPDAFQCDYDILLGDPANLPPEDYLIQYEWAEEVRAQLYFAAHPEE